MHPSEGRPGERWSGGSAVRARHSRKESINSQRSATSETAALRDRAVLEFHPLEKNVIAQCSDSGGWTSRRRSRAGRRQRVRGLGGGACAGTLRLAVPGARSPLPPGTARPRQIRRVLGYRGSSQLQQAPWVERREGERRWGGRVEFRNLCPKRRLAERAAPFHAALRGGRGAAQTGR